VAESKCPLLVIHRLNGFAPRFIAVRRISERFILYPSHLH
jgi:hypothetical protein